MEGLNQTSSEPVIFETSAKFSAHAVIPHPPMMTCPLGWAGALMICVLTLIQLLPGVQPSSRLAFGPTVIPLGPHPPVGGVV